MKGSPCSVLDRTSQSIDRDEPRLEEEVQRNGIDAVIAVHDFLASSSCSSSEAPSIESLASSSSSSSEAPSSESQIEAATESPTEEKNESPTEALVISASTGRTKRQPVELSDKPPSKKR